MEEFKVQFNNIIKSKQIVLNWLVINIFVNKIIFYNKNFLL